MVDDALAARAGALWLQIGCIDEATAPKLKTCHSM